MNKTTLPCVHDSTYASVGILSIYTRTHVLRVICLDEHTNLLRSIRRSVANTPIAPFTVSCDSVVLHGVCSAKERSKRSKHTPLRDTPSIRSLAMIPVQLCLRLPFQQTPTVLTQLCFHSAAPMWYSVFHAEVCCTCSLHQSKTMETQVAKQNKQQ